MSRVNFLGLGFELGQEFSGLADSSDHLRSYFALIEKQGIKLVDQGTVHAKDSIPQKIYSQTQFKNTNWTPYINAYNKIKKLLDVDETLVNWGGDHSVALSTVGAYCSKHPTGFVLWIDAHADLNLPDFSITGNLHGMPMSVLFNLNQVRKKHFPWIENSLDTDKLIYLGLRDLDPFEKDIIEKFGIKVYTTHDVQKRGMKVIADEIMQTIQDLPLHISFDIDSLSPECAPSTGVPVSNGLQISDLLILGQKLSQHQLIRSFDVVEINPRIGSIVEVNDTYLAAITFICTTLKHGGLYAGASRTYQTYDTTQMESCS